MYIKSLVLFWLFSVPALAVDSTISSLFVIKQGTDESGGCGSYFPTPLETWFSESKALVNSGLQALADAQNPSAAEYDVARRYLWSYFRATDDADAIAWVKKYLLEVKLFLDGTSTELDETPRLYCNDKWLTKLSRSDAAWDTSKDETILKVNPDGSMVPMSIEEVEEYEDDLWEEKNGLLVRNKNIPYWSDDLSEYVFDIGYGGKTYCTASKKNLGATQQQTIPNTVTLCPSSFTNPDAVDGLGSATPKKGLSIMKVLPQSATLYHELFHLLLGNSETPDITYSWTKQQTMLKNPTTMPKGYDESYAQLIRRNPETYVFFSVGYWYFQQTQWSTQANERWSFHSGAAQLVAM